MGLVDALNGFERQIAEAGSAAGDVRDDLLAHARFPEFLQVIGDAGYSFFARVGLKEKGDLIRHVHHVL